MKVSVKNPYKSITVVQDFEIPDFVVLTGKNGSGKSHLMELMARTGDSAVTDEYGNQLLQIKYIPFNGLNPNINENCEYLNLTNNRKNAWNEVKRKKDDYLFAYNRNNAYSLKQYLNGGGDRKRILDKWVKLVDGDINAITEDFFYEHYEIVSNEIFSSQFASIFKLYHVRYLENEFNDFYNIKHGGHFHVLSDDEFKKRYGPKPWDLINGMLLRAGLTYQVNNPDEDTKEMDFNLHLTDVNTGTEIHVNDLSTGEKVLMSLALSIYNSKEELARPDVLLLDEPDAALHPDFSKVLLSAIEESIVKDAKVKVMISTHSPVTVALAPEESIFLMDKSQCKPVKISKQKAVNILTKDLDNIRLSYENRRQVFVESKYDVQYYTKIKDLISVELPTVPQFLPPRSGDGANCADVKEIVNRLTKAGNDLVYGIIDSDNTNHSSDRVFVLGEGNRYAIDNYVFDPIYVAFLLVREGIVKTEDMGLPPKSYSQLSSLNDGEIQLMIDYVIKTLGLEGDTIEYAVQSEKAFKATKQYFLHNGHDLETKIKDTWKPLYGVVHGKGDNALKNHVLCRVCDDYPEFISTDFINLFKKIE